MEHSSVIDPAVPEATRNLTHTYLELGRSIPDAHVWQEDGFRGCTGSLDHPICNFAADIQPRASTVERLRQVAETRKSFTLYLLPPHDGVEARQTLENEGFTLSHELKLMVSGEVGGEDQVELEQVGTREDRQNLAEFMVDQFFHKQPTGFKRGIGEATAAAKDLKLYRALWNGRTAGAVMICEHAGITGLYNLCVAPQFRGRGWGSAIVRTIVKEAKERHLSVTLQCEPSLASWYSSLGFREVGAVSVYGLYRFKEIDIMG